MQNTCKFFTCILIGLSSILLTCHNANAYERSPNVSLELWEQLTPYFLPEDSPEREALDEIFAKHRVLKSEKAMRKAGFLIISPTDKIIVARHHKIKGFLVKVYIDNKSTEDETYWWLKRASGARAVRECIYRHGFQDFMKVPQKWIYPLPLAPLLKDGKKHRHFILVVEDVFPLNQEKNRRAYKRRMTPKILDALYILLKENFLIDSVYADNTPFCKDGKIAFLDTEHAFDHTRPVPFSTVGDFLSSDMVAYWEQLLNHGGPH